MKSLIKWAWKVLDAEEAIMLVIRKHLGSSRSGSHHNDHLVDKTKKSVGTGGAKKTYLLVAFNGKPNPSLYKGKGRPTTPHIFPTPTKEQGRLRQVVPRASNEHA